MTSTPPPLSPLTIISPSPSSSSLHIINTHQHNKHEQKDSSDAIYNIYSPKPLPSQLLTVPHTNLNTIELPNPNTLNFTEGTDFDRRLAARIRSRLILRTGLSCSPSLARFYDGDDTCSDSSERDSSVINNELIRPRGGLTSIPSPRLASPRLARFIQGKNSESDLSDSYSNDICNEVKVTNTSKKEVEGRKGFNRRSILDSSKDCDAPRPVATAINRTLFKTPTSPCALIRSISVNDTILEDSSKSHYENTPTHSTGIFKTISRLGLGSRSGIGLTSILGINMSRQLSRSFASVDVVKDLDENENVGVRVGKRSTSTPTTVNSTPYVSPELTLNGDRKFVLPPGIKRTSNNDDDDVNDVNSEKRCRVHFKCIDNIKRKVRRSNRVLPFDDSETRDRDRDRVHDDHNNENENDNDGNDGNDEEHVVLSEKNADYEVNARININNYTFANSFGINSAFESGDFFLVKE